MDDRATCLPWGKNFYIDIPRTTFSLRRITEILLNFTRGYRDILVCQVELSTHPGTDTKKSSMGWGSSQNVNSQSVNSQNINMSTPKISTPRILNVNS